MSLRRFVECLILLLYSSAHADSHLIAPPVLQASHFVAPDLRLVDLNGTERRLAEFRGKVVLLNVWGTWCPGCVLEMPTLERLSLAYDHDPHVIILLASLNDTRSNIIAFRSKHHCESQMFLIKDDDLPRGLQLHAYPETFLIDDMGVVRFEHTGAADWSSAPVMSQIERLRREGRNRELSLATGKSHKRK